MAASVATRIVGSANADWSLLPYPRFKKSWRKEGLRAFSSNQEAIPRSANSANRAASFQRSDAAMSAIDLNRMRGSSLDGTKPRRSRQKAIAIRLRQIGTTGKIPIYRNPKSGVNSGHPVPTRGAVARRHERGMGCGGRDSVGAHGGRRAR
jgi:hypothetical protein